MCVFCAAIPVTAAVETKLNADQLQKAAAQRLSIPKLTAALMGCLVIASALYHTWHWHN